MLTIENTLHLKDINVCNNKVLEYASITNARLTNINTIINDIKMLEIINCGRLVNLSTIKGISTLVIKS